MCHEPELPTSLKSRTAATEQSQMHLTASRGVQAAVMEVLGLDDNAPYMDVSAICQGLIKSFAAFIHSHRGHPLGTMPLHGPDVYLRVWNQIQALGDKPLDESELCGFTPGTTHPGLISDVPRKRRTGALVCQVRFLHRRAALHHVLRLPWDRHVLTHAPVLCSRWSGLGLERQLAQARWRRPTRPCP